MSEGVQSYEELTNNLTGMSFTRNISAREGALFSMRLKVLCLFPQNMGLKSNRLSSILFVSTSQMQNNPSISCMCVCYAQIEELLLGDPENEELTEMYNSLAEERTCDMLKKENTIVPSYIQCACR
jgi:hypothetical protein